jgi:hypothetical protein
LTPGTSGDEGFDFVLSARRKWHHVIASGGNVGEERVGLRPFPIWMIREYLGELSAEVFARP